MREPLDGSEISVVIQGPMRDKSGASLQKAVASIREHLPGAEIIVSTWVGETVDEALVDKVVYTKDPGPDRGSLGSSNQSRQSLSTVVGLRVAERPMALKWRVEFFLTSNRFAKTSANSSDQRIRVLSSVTPDPLQDPRYFHLSDLIQFGRTQELLNCWELVLAQPPAFRDRAKRYNFWLEPFGNDPMARRPEQAFTISLARSKGYGVELNRIGCVKSNYMNFRGYLEFVSDCIEIVSLESSGVATEQQRFYRSDHNYSTHWQAQRPRIPVFLRSRVRWLMTKTGSTLAVFWLLSSLHPNLAGFVKRNLRQISG